MYIALVVSLSATEMWKPFFKSHKKKAMQMVMQWNAGTFSIGLEVVLSLAELNWRLR